MTAPRRPRRTRTPPDGARLLTAQEAVRYTGIAYSTLRGLALGVRARLDRDPRPPALPCVQVPGCRRLWFDRADLDAAILRWKR
jgi:hypothetical protein